MPGIRVVQLSDPHLSATHPHFQDNWESVLDWLSAERPDLVVVSGDVALSDPDRSEDLVHARAQLERIPVPWRVIPGNHDIGDSVLSGTMAERVTPGRLECWRALFGPDWWCLAAGGWQLVGLNAQLLNSGGLAAEAEQAAWLADTLAETPPEQPVALFLHKPLFVDHPSEQAVTSDCIDPPGRAALVALLRGRRVRLVASGHKHQYRAFGVDGVLHVWAPATSGVNLAPNSVSHGRRVVGFIDYRLDPDGRVRQTLRGADFLVRHESYVLKLEHGGLLAGPAFAADGHPPERRPADGEGR